MNLNVLTASVLLALTSFLSCSPSVSDVELTPGFSTGGLGEIRDSIREDIDERRIAGAVVLLDHNGNTVMFESFGFRNLETEDPMRNDAIFRIYSMTKPVTSVAVMMLHERGQLDLDDSAGKYFPELSGLEVLEADQLVKAKREITIRDLLSHMSGFTYGLFDVSPVDQMYNEANVLIGAQSLHETVDRLGELPLKNQPGEVWEYSVSTDVLARLVEVVSDQTFDEFLEQEIFAPLGMVDTGFLVPTEKLPRLAGSYESTEEGLNPVADWMPVDKRPSYLSGGGGLFSTASDYLTFCRMILGRGAIGETRLLQPESVDAMAVDRLANLPGREEYVLRVGDLVVPGGFGLGFGIIEANSPMGESHQLFWYGIASTMFWIDRDQGLIGIYMVQQQPFDTSLGDRFRELTYEAGAAVESQPAR